MPEYATNIKAPYQRRFWAIHDNRVRHLTMLERGVYDAVQAALWSVVGARMDEGTLLRMLRLGRKEKVAFDALFSYGLLQRDGEMVFDEVQQQDWENSLKTSQTKSAASKARWDKHKDSPKGLSGGASEVFSGDTPEEF